MAGYANAMNTAMPDIQQWVVDHPTGGDTGLIVAANALFGSIAASNAFIGSLAAQEVSILGTLKTGTGAEENCRVGIQDESGIQSKVFTGSGNNDLSVVEDGAIAGTIVATITDAQVGDVGPTGGKLFAVAPNSEAAPSDLAAFGWDDAVTAAAASTLGGKDDWVLPTRAQLTALRTALGSTEALRAALGLSEFLYWTSEESGTNAYAIDMVTGAESLKTKIRSLFETTVTMPHSMNRRAMAHVDGKLYFPDGYGTSLEIYDIAGGTFITKTMPHTMSRATMAHVDGKLYFPESGGTSLEIYDIAGETFTTKTMPSSMYRWTMAHVGGKLYFPQHDGTSLEIYDIAGGTFITKTMPHTMSRKAMAHVDGKLYFPQDGGTSLEIYDIAGGTFTTVTMPHSMSRYTMVHVDGKLYFPQWAGTSLEIYDIAGGTFITKTMPSSMYREAMAHVDGKLYFPENNGTSFEIYDIAGGTFTTKTMPHKMNRNTMVHVDGKLYFPQTAGTSLEIYLLPLPSRAIRSNTETRRWKHTTDTGSGPSAPVAHGVIAAYAQVAIDLDITVAFQSVTNHITGNYWTIIQGSMYGLSIKDGSGVEYVKASNGGFGIAAPQTNIITASVTIGLLDNSVLVNTANVVTITLPSGCPIGHEVKITRLVASTNAVTVARSGTDTIEGLTSFDTHGSTVASTLNNSEVVLKKISATEWKFVGGEVSGSNTNGLWIKYSDGTMIQWGSRTPATNNNSGTIYDYPSNEFISIKALLGTVNGISSGGLNGSYVCETSILGALQYRLKVLAHTPTTIVDTTVSISWHAIGLWR
jgi:hypothetical protein